MTNEEKLFQDKKSLEKEEKKQKEEAAALALPIEEKKADKAAEKKAAEAEKKEKSKEVKPAAAAQKKGEEKEEEVKKREIVLERAFNVPLSKAYEKPKYKRSDRAVKLLRQFIEKHMKADVVKISPEVNETIRHSGSPLKKVSVIASKDKEGLALVELKK